MARIETYNNDNTINPTDKLIGTDGAVGALNATKNFEMSALKSYIYPIDLAQKTVTITSTQLLTLNGGGTIELLSAPGADKILVVDEAFTWLDFATTAYNFAFASGSDGVKLNNGTEWTGAAYPAAQFLNATADDYNRQKTHTYPQAYVPNAAFNLHATSGVSVSQGDSPIKFNIIYRIVDLQ
jgi:hypothetical protein